MEIALLRGVSEQQAERLLYSAATLCADYPSLLTEDHERALRGRRARMTKLDSWMAKITIKLTVENTVAIVDRVRKMSILTLEAMHTSTTAGPGACTGASAETQQRS